MLLRNGFSAPTPYMKKNIQNTHALSNKLLKQIYSYRKLYVLLHCRDERADRITYQGPRLNNCSLLASSEGSIPGQQHYSLVISSTAWICAHSYFELCFRKSNTQKAMEVDKKLEQLFSILVIWYTIPLLPEYTISSPPSVKYFLMLTFTSLDNQTLPRWITAPVGWSQFCPINQF